VGGWFFNTAAGGHVLVVTGKKRHKAVKRGRDTTDTQERVGRGGKQKVGFLRGGDWNSRQKKRKQSKCPQG